MTSPSAVTVPRYAPSGTLAATSRSDVPERPPGCVVLTVLGRTEADDLAAVVDRRGQAQSSVKCGKSPHVPVLPEIRAMPLLASEVVASPVDSPDNLVALVDPERNCRARRDRDR